MFIFKLTARICYKPDPDDGRLFYFGLASSASSICLFIIFMVYAFHRKVSVEIMDLELRYIDFSNLKTTKTCLYLGFWKTQDYHMKIVMCHSLSLSVASASLAIAQITITHWIFLGYIIYYFLLSSFFWQTIVSLDIWLQLRYVAVHLCFKIIIY